MQRKILALFLAVLICFSSLALAACNNQTPETTEQTPNTNQAPTTPSDSQPSDIPFTGVAYNPFENEATVGQTKKEHQTLTEIPSYYTLVGSTTLPPVENQGAVGSCASESVAYMQFTNAVAQYVQNVLGDKNWTPSKGSITDTSNPNNKYIFSPKFTYLFSSAGTAWVYNILSDHGCATIDYSMFHKSGTGSVIQAGTGFFKDSLKWDVQPGELLNALQFRITDYEQIWCTKAPYDGKLTTSETGLKLINKIKEAVASGNVVVTGGYPSRWKTTNVIGKGNLGTIGEKIISYSVAEGDGGHQVCIVGYDDDITTKVGNQILKGAFLMVNSWGTTYMNDGYVWVSYDALNTVSEFEELNDKRYERGWTFDQFCFTYWDSDITNELPALMAEVEIEAEDRESFYIELTREDATGTVESHMPYMFYYGAGNAKIHDSYGVTNFGGDVDKGIKDTGYFTLSYADLTSLIPSDKTINDYIWGVKVYSVTTSKTVTVKSLKLLNSKKEVISEVVPTESMSVLEGGKDVYYKFKLSDKTANYTMSGQYLLQNGSNYITTNKTSFTTTNSADKALKLELTFDNEKNTYTIGKPKENYVIDISGKNIKPDVEVRLNAKSDTRPNQVWKLYGYEDGTYAIYLANPDNNGVWYAIGLKDGKTVLVTGDDVQKYGKWTLVNSSVSAEDISVDISCDNGEYKLTVNNNTKKDITSLNVVDANGEIVKSDIECGKEISIGKLSSGTYSIVADHPTLSLVYFFVVK